MGLDWDEGPDPVRRLARETGDPTASPSAARSTSAPLVRLAAAGRIYPCFCTASGSKRTDRRPSRRGAHPDTWAGAPRSIRARAGSPDRGGGGARGAVPRRKLRRRPRPAPRRGSDFRAREAVRPGSRAAATAVRPTTSPVVVDDAVDGDHPRPCGAEDHLTNTGAAGPACTEALDLAPPLFAHLPLILEAMGRRSRSATAPSSVGEMKAQGTPAKALVGSLALWDGRRRRHRPSRRRGDGRALRSERGEPRGRGLRYGEARLDRARARSRRWIRSSAAVRSAPFSARGSDRRWYAAGRRRARRRTSTPG
jgi:glutamyl-tRNA synthetase